MTEETGQVLEQLRSALLEDAEAAASIAQLLLENAAQSEAAAPWRRDLSRIRQSALRLYRAVRQRLHAPHGTASPKTIGDRLHRVRHDIRGILGNVLNRCQLVMLEADGLDEELRADLDRIRDHARRCVDHLDQHREVARDETPAEAPAPIPAGRSPAAGPAAPLISLPATDITGASILVADDNPTSRELLGRFLKRHGHDVAFAADGREALDLLQARDFDLVLLDVIMPRADGFEVLARMREAGKLAHTPVIVISGMDSGPNVVRCIEMGAEDFLPRPIDMALLKARVSSCLERQRLREREFAQFFTPELARQLVRRPEILTGGRSMEVSVLFCDIVGFSRISERLGAIDTIRWLSDVLDALAACVMDEGGVLVNYVGDQIMAMWGAPEAQPDHADRACRTAIAMMKVLPQFDRRWRSTIGARTEASIGINSGEAFVGNVGTPRKFQYGALGNMVNLASRVQSATKYVRAPVLMTHHTQARLKIRPPHRRLGKFRVNNIEEPVGLFELAASPPADWLPLRRGYERALACFEKHQLGKASSLLGNLLVKYPNDGPSLLLMSRVAASLFSDETTFDPVWTFSAK